MGKVGFAVCGLIIVGFGAFVLKEPPPGSIGAEMRAMDRLPRHSDCWYKMQPAVRHYPEARRSDEADALCAMADSLANRSDLSRSQAADLISRM